jgi:hypothetical protein
VLLSVPLGADMKRVCVSCKKEMDVPTLKTKYCAVCAKITHRIKAREWKRNNTTRREYDLFCLDCNDTLPVNSKGDKKYCEKCLRKRINKIHTQWAISRRKKEKLDIFFKNLRINFIQNPYLIERKRIVLTV